MHPHANDGFDFDRIEAPEPGAQAQRRAFQPPPRKDRLTRWLTQLRCLCLGHAWRQSRHLQGYETCARCRTRRLPLV